jgi:hypothetical protein
MFSTFIWKYMVNCYFFGHFSGSTLLFEDVHTMAKILQVSMISTTFEMAWSQTSPSTACLIDELSSCSRFVTFDSLFSLPYPYHCLSTNQTPNPILGTDDIQSLDREYIPEGAVYPANERYTLQCLKRVPQQLSAFIPVNRDAAFRESSDEQKPSGLLLHYNYGAAAVKVWGHGKEVLEAHR